MNWQRIKQTIRILGSVIGFGIFAYLVSIAARELTGISGLLVIHWEYFVYTFFLAMSIYVMQMINYQWLVSSLGVDSRLKQIVIGYASSFLHKYIPGYIWGYFSRADWYASQAAIPTTNSWMASVLEVVTTVATSFAIWIAYRLAINESNLILLILVMLIPNFVFIPFNLAISSLKKSEKASRYVNGLYPITLLKWTKITINSYFQWALFGFGLSMISRVFSLEIHLSLKNLMGFVYSFARAWVTGFLTILIPNGLGIREVVLKELLIEVNHIGPSVSVLVSTSYRLVMMAAELGWVILAILLNRRRLNKK